MLFQGLFESFLRRRNATVRRYEPVFCAKGHPLNRAVVREQLSGGADFAFCAKCGDKVTLPKVDEPIQLNRQQQKEVNVQHRLADLRARFEQAVFRLQTYVKQQGIKAPECFISYPWGQPEHERWVERNLATDLQKAGIDVVLDRWENAKIGASVSRFVERLEKCDQIIVVGTPLYREKYENKDTSTGYVVAAEVDMISNRLLGTEAQKETVLPVLLAGEKTSSLPPLLHGRVYADFRADEAYFTTAFDLILSLYQLPLNDRAVTDLRESLRGTDM
jgi:TIR domain